MSTTTTGIQPPLHDADAEAAVLGSMMQDPTCIPAVLQAVTRDMFFAPEHRTIFSAITALHGRNGHGDGPDGLLVREELERRSQLDGIGGTDYLRKVIESTPSSANHAHYSGIVANRYHRREAMEAGRRLMDGAADLSRNIAEELADARMDLGEIALPTAVAIAPCDAAAWLTTEPPAADQVLAGTFDRGDKVTVIGSSKLRKSFFLLQGMLSIAAGRDFLGWHVPKARRVYAVQFEIQVAHFHRRVKRMAKAMGLTPTDLADRFQVVNARGLGLAGRAGIMAILEAAKPFAPDIICVDPLYKIASGVENAAEDFKLVLNAFDELAEVTGAAIAFVHHDAKGHSGDRDIRDRGAGSNVLGRDYDACLTLTPHASEEDTAVVESLLRNYRPQEPFSISWTDDAETGGYCFVTRPDVIPNKQTSRSARAKSGPTFGAMEPAAMGLLAEGPMAIGQFKDELKLKTGLGRDRCDELVRHLLLSAENPLDVYETRGKGRHIKYIGTPEQIGKLKDQS